MRIACLQFAPQVGDVSNNLNRADAVLSRANIKDLDLLVLPELAFSGYNFRSLHHISPYLEPTSAGITSLWSRTTALKYNCVVVAGYPEKVDITPKWPASPEYYNSAITVNKEGETIANYRKSFLYYTDETWALEGPDGFYDGVMPGLGNVAMGICMDLNPYKFEAPWNAWEFAHHVLHREANLVILSMAWLTREDARSYSRKPRDPDLETLSYWLSRLEPLIRAEGEEEIIAVFANRCGVEGDAVYAGTSAILGIHAGEVKVYGILGRGERELLVVDTAKRPQMQLVSEPKAKVKAQRAKAEAQAQQRMRGPDNISSASSASTLDSDYSVDTPGLSISTDRTSDMDDDFNIITPPLEQCIITPTSPVGATFTQAYFADQRIEPPSIATNATTSQPRRPTPSLPSPTFCRPPSPKSRNTSRSRGPAHVESPALGRSFTPDVRTTREEAMRHLERVRATPSLPVAGPDQQEITPIMDEEQFGPERAPSIQISATPTSNDVQPISSPSNSRSDTIDERLSRADLVQNRTSHTASVMPLAQNESSFTRNSLGPRSRHVSPRPLSTIW